MRKPTPLLAVLPALLLLTTPAAQAAQSSHHAKKKLVRLADEVADGARLVHRSALGRNGRYSHWGRGHNHVFYGPRDAYTLRTLAELESRALDFERALRRRPILHTRHELDELNRAFDRAAAALYRTRVGPAVERDFECLAEYLYSLNGYYEEYVYPRRARYRGYDGTHYNPEIEIYGPRWNIVWRGSARGGDSDSDSY